MADELDYIGPEEQQLLRIRAGMAEGRLDPRLRTAAQEPTVQKYPVYSYPEQWGNRPNELGSVGTSKEILGQIQAEKDAADKPFGDTGINVWPIPAVANIGRQFWYGGNVAVNAGKDIYRKLTNDYDPAWNKETIGKWLDGKPEIPADKWSWYYQTGSQGEANALLAGTKDNEWAARLNSHRGGVENFIAGTAAGFVDIDLPLTLASFGVSKMAAQGLKMTRTGVLMEQAALGAGSAVVSNALDMAVTPGRSYEDAILSTLVGTGIGIISGGIDAAIMTKNGAGAAVDAGLQDVTHDMRRSGIHETAENVAAGYEPKYATHSVLEPEPTPVHPPKEPVDGSPAPKVEEVPEAPKARPDAPEPTPEALPGTPRVEEQSRPQVFDVNDAIIEDTDFDPLTNAPNSNLSAAGANQHGTRTHSGPGLRSIADPETRRAVDANLRWRRRSNEVADWENTASVLSADSALTDQGVRMAIRFRDALAKVYITNDFDVLMGSGLAGAQRFATAALESASGIARGKVTAALMKEGYANELKAAFAPYHDAFKDWHYVEQGYKLWSGIGTPLGTGAWKSKDDFNKEILTELMSRRFGGPGTTSKAAKAGADAVEATYRLEHEIGKGRGKDIPLAGYDQFQWTPGHFSQVWSGRKMSQALEDASAKGGRVLWEKTKQNYIDSLDEMYAAMSPEWDAVLRKKVATTVIERAIASRRGFQHDLIALLSGDESDYIRTALKNNGVTDGEIESVITMIMGSRTDKTQLRQTRRRQDVDFRFTSSSGVNMMDMLETDIELVLGRRMLQTSGLAALARIGITNRVDFEKVKKTILAEQEARGARIPAAQSPTPAGINFKDKIDAVLDSDKVVTPELLDGIYGYFSGIRPNGRTAEDAVIQRIKKVTQLSLMNQLGLTSLGEFGTISGSVGFRRMWQHFSDDLKYQFTGKQTDLHNELRALAIFVPEEQMFNARLMHDIDQAEVGSIGAVFDALLNKGVELQGVISGFYKVRAMQQMTAISSVTAKVWEGAKYGRKGYSAERLADMGFDDAFMNRVLRHADFEGARLKRLNMDWWDPRDVEHYRRVIARSTHQLVQKALAGESNWAFSNSGLAQLFWQLKSFPLLAINKQFVRNARFGDTEMLMTYIHGIALSSAVYAAKESINDKGSELTPEKILRGGLNYANMTGWMPMIVDPVLGAIGSEASLSGYSSRGIGSVISIPASLSTLDRMLQLPGAVMKLPQSLATTAMGNPQHTDQQMSNAQIRALQAIPLIGNMYGMAAILNHAKEPWDRELMPKKPKKVKPENAPPTATSPLDLKGRAWQELSK